MSGVRFCIKINCELRFNAILKSLIFLLCVIDCRHKTKKYFFRKIVFYFKLQTNCNGKRKNIKQKKKNDTPIKQELKKIVLGTKSECGDASQFKSSYMNIIAK